jgi:hypothetical protein
LQGLTDSAEPRLASEAAVARAEMLAFLEGNAVPTWRGENPLRVIECAEDDRRPLHDRLDAIAALPIVLAPAMAAVRDASFANANYRANFEVTRKRFARLLKTEASR